MTTRQRRPKLTIARIDERERALMALELRRQGKTWDAIAKELRYADKTGPHHAVAALLTRYEAKQIDEYRSLAVERYERLLDEVWPLAMQELTQTAMEGCEECGTEHEVTYHLDQLPKIRAIESAARLTDRIATLLGLAITRESMEPPEGGSVSPRERIEQRLAEIAARAAAAPQFTPETIEVESEPSEETRAEDDAADVVLAADDEPWDPDPHRDPDDAPRIRFH